MMALGFLIPLLFLALVIFGVRKLVSVSKERTGTSFSIRQVFQYLILFGVVIISGVGVSGLLGRVLDFNRVIAEDRTALARNLTFTIVGLPMTYFLARWTSQSFHRAPEERLSLAWRGYLTVSSITSLSLALSGFHDLLSWAIGNDPYGGNAISRAAIWTLVWVFYWRIAKTMTDSEAGIPHLVIGSAIGLSIISVGIGGLIGNVIESLLDSGTSSAIAETTNPIVNSSINILLGAPLWYQYWLRHLKNRPRGLLWYLYIFLAGITAGFITTVASTSVAIYDVLVWFFGDVGGKSATEHFISIAQPIGSALIGFALWWYHRAVLGTKERSEVRRIYEYIISGVSLIAAALGLLMIFVAVIEGLTPSDLVKSVSQSNTLIVASTLLLVGTPVWWFFWNRIEKRISEGGQSAENEEITSPTRRIFILMLFGVAGIAAVVSVITSVFFLFDDLLNSQLALETLRKARFALGILVTNGAIAGYHWSIYRHEKEFMVRRARAEKYVLLVGPGDGEIARELQKKIGGRVQLWETPEPGLHVSDGEAWDMGQIMSLINDQRSNEIMILNEKRKLRAIPIHRP